MQQTHNPEHYPNDEISLNGQFIEDFAEHLSKEIALLEDTHLLRNFEGRIDRSRIRGPYVRFCERDEASLIGSPHPTRFECWISKGKNQTVGVARQQRHFLCGDKENEAKESLTRRLACLDRSVSGGKLSYLITLRRRHLPLR